jgi:SAM-dependent methyltransferase
MSDNHENAYAIYHMWKDWSEESFGRVSPELHSAYSAIFTSHANFSKGLAIDFGFGNGEMLNTLRSAGFEVMGVERNPILREIATRKGYEAFESLVDVRLPKDEKIAVITAFHVLEHLDCKNLLETLTQFSKLLKPGGVVLAAFPNGDSPFSASAFNGDITHVTLIGSSMAEQIGLMTGLNLTVFHDFPSLSTYSPQLILRFKGIVRHSIEKLLNQVLSRIYYGGTKKALSPVALAVWTKT